MLEESSNDSKWSSVWPPLVYFVATLVLCLRRGLQGAIVSDNQHYFYVAERVAASISPHLAHFDPKSALSLLLTGWAISVGRFVGCDDVVAARVISIVAVATAAALVWTIARTLSRDRLAAHCAALAFLSHGSLLGMAVLGARPKVFLVFFLLLTLWASMRGSALRFGVATGLSFLCWQPAALVGIGGVEPLLRSRRRVRALIALILGFALPLLLYELYFVVVGGFFEQIEQSFFYPAAYMSHPRLLPALAPLRQHAFWALRIGADFSLATVVPWGFLVVSAWCLLLLVLRPRASLRLLRERQALATLILAALAALAFTVYDYQGFPDTFLFVPFFSIAVGWGLVHMARTIGGILGRRVGGVLAFVLVAVLAWNVASVPTFAGRGLTVQRALSRRVGAMLDQGLSVQAIGCTHLLALAHAGNFVRYGFLFRGMGEYLSDTFRRRPYQPRRAGALPDVVLWSRGRVRSHANWLRHYYTEVTPPEFARRRIQLWLRKTRDRRLLGI